MNVVWDASGIRRMDELPPLRWYERWVDGLLHYVDLTWLGVALIATSYGFLMEALLRAIR